MPYHAGPACWPNAKRRVRVLVLHLVRQCEAQRPAPRMAEIRTHKPIVERLTRGGGRVRQSLVARIPPRYSARKGSRHLSRYRTRGRIRLRARQHPGARAYAVVVTQAQRNSSKLILQSRVQRPEEFCRVRRRCSASANCDGFLKHGDLWARCNLESKASSNAPRVRDLNRMIVDRLVEIAVAQSAIRVGHRDRVFSGP